MGFSTPSNSKKPKRPSQPSKEENDAGLCAVPDTSSTPRVGESMIVTDVFSILTEMGPTVKEGVNF
jgi:hypothetical protein